MKTIDNFFDFNLSINSYRIVYERSVNILYSLKSSVNTNLLFYECDLLFELSKIKVLLVNGVLKSKDLFFDVACFSFDTSNEAKIDYLKLSVYFSILE